MMYVFVMNLVFTEPVQGSSIEFSQECVTTRHRRGTGEKNYCRKVDGVTKPRQAGLVGGRKGNQ